MQLKIKNKIKKITPKILLDVVFRTRIVIPLISGYYYDFIRFIKYSATFKSKYNFFELEAKIFAHCHVIEKGLSFKNVKFGFGKDIILSIINLLSIYKVSGFDINKKVYKVASSTLKEYINYHKNNNYILDKNILEGIKKIELDNFNCINCGGTVEFKKDDLLSLYKKDFYTLAKNRYSIRNFTDEKISVDIILESIKLAQKSPSVCNRQGSRVYIIEKESVKQKLLEVHNGNRGFGNLADKILVVTSDLSIFEGVGERNQSFVDSGIFSMSLLYSLTYFGIATCTLNWCTDKNKDKLYRSIVGIKKEENVALMILVGGMPDTFKVAMSVRKDLEDIITIV